MNSDNPINTKNEDMLNRQPFANRIANLINDHKNKESVVIGIEGQWGSGKTSFINLVLGSLKKAVVTKFNPWNFSDQNELIKDFFESLVSALSEENEYNEIGKEKLDKIKNYASKLLQKAEFNFNPEISVGFLSLKLGDKIKLGKEKTLAEQKEDINQILKQMRNKIIVVIDDIDRLDKHETKLIFKMVKMTANFSNTVFLLAYDRQKVCERLKEDGFDGEEYLKKIIQVSFELPKVEENNLYKILFSRLDIILKNFNEEKYWDQTRWGNLFHAGMKNFFKNIRDINCYTNSLNLDIEIIGKEEINPIDFFGTETLRVFTPKLFSFIADNKDKFTSYLSGPYDDKKKETIKEEINSEIGKIPEGLREDALGIAKQLFPQVAGIYENSSYGSDWEAGWRKELRTCSSDNFDKYFLLTLPSDKVSIKQLNEILEIIKTDESIFKDKLKELNDSEKIGNFLWKLIDVITDLKKDDKLKILISIADFSVHVEHKKKGVFDLDTIDIQVMRLGYQFIKSLPKDERVEFVKSYIEGTKNVYAAVQIADVLEDGVEKFKNKTSIDDPLIDETEIKGLNSLALIKIKSSANERNLHLSFGPLVLFYQWKKLENKEAVNGYIHELIKNKNGLIDFLKVFKNENISQSVSDYVAKRKDVFYIKALREFVDQKIIDQKIAQYKSYSKEQQEVIDLYHKALDNENKPFD
jgi:predicted KAP-like P-loop ATPase